MEGRGEGRVPFLWDLGCGDWVMGSEVNVGGLLGGTTKYSVVCNQFDKIYSKSNRGG